MSQTLTAASALPQHVERAQTYDVPDDATTGTVEARNGEPIVIVAIGSRTTKSRNGGADVTRLYLVRENAEHVQQGLPLECVSVAVRDAVLTPALIVELWQAGGIDPADVLAEYLTAPDAAPEDEQVEVAA